MANIYTSTHSLHTYPAATQPSHSSHRTYSASIGHRHGAQCRLSSRCLCGTHNTYSLRLATRNTIQMRILSQSTLWHCREQISLNFSAFWVHHEMFFSGKNFFSFMCLWDFPIEFTMVVGWRAACICVHSFRARLPGDRYSFHFPISVSPIFLSPRSCRCPGVLTIVSLCAHKLCMFNTISGFFSHLFVRDEMFNVGCLTLVR